MKYGFWMPVFGGWLRNVEDEGMEASWDYVKRLTQAAEKLGYDLTLIAELMLNDIKGIQAPSMDAWTTAAALAAVTEKLELLVAVRPTYHAPGPFAKQVAQIDQISQGRLSLNVVSSWWKDEAKRFGIPFDVHDDRYARTTEWLQILDAAFHEPEVTFHGRYYDIEGLIVEPKPVRKPRPLIYAGGESEAAKNMIARLVDVYVMHGDPPERLLPKIADMKRRRESFGLPPMQFGVAAYSIIRGTQAEVDKEIARITDVSPGSSGYANYQDFIQNSQLDQVINLEDYSVSNRGLKSGLMGTPQQVIDRIGSFADVGVDLFLLQCSPQLEEMQRFSEDIIQKL
jgi:FMNH2-dependent dimethyl sulfone monooxygenase